MALGVSPYFKNGDKLIELYSGQKSIVEDGKITFAPNLANIWVIVKANEYAN